MHNPKLPNIQTVLLPTVYHLDICVLLQTEIPEADNRVTKSNGSDVGGTWLQLMCCTLPKHLCP